jgi:hypothetical protein
MSGLPSLNDRHFAYSRPFQFALPVGVEEILVAARRAARECEEATSFTGLPGDQCQRLVTLEFEIHIARNGRPFRYMLLDPGITPHRSAAVLRTSGLRGTHGSATRTLGSVTRIALGGRRARRQLGKRYRHAKR